MQPNNNNNNTTTNNNNKNNNSIEDELFFDLFGEYCLLSPPTLTESSPDSGLGSPSSYASTLDDDLSFDSCIWENKEDENRIFLQSALHDLPCDLAEERKDQLLSFEHHPTSHFEREQCNDIFQEFESIHHGDDGICPDFPSPATVENEDWDIYENIMDDFDFEQNPSEAGVNDNFSQHLWPTQDIIMTDDVAPAQDMKPCLDDEDAQITERSVGSTLDGPLSPCIEDIIPPQMIYQLQPSVSSSFSSMSGIDHQDVPNISTSIREEGVSPVVGTLPTLTPKPLISVSTTNCMLNSPNMGQNMKVYHTLISGQPQQSNDNTYKVDAQKLQNLSSLVYETLAKKISNRERTHTGNQVGHGDHDYAYEGRVGAGRGERAGGRNGGTEEIRGKGGLREQDEGVGGEGRGGSQVGGKGLMKEFNSLTYEEMKMLEKEGSNLPEGVKLSKEEKQKLLKRVRRKIKNKQSAMESRRKRKAYVDNLEHQLSQYNSFTDSLNRKVLKLSKENQLLTKQVKAMKAFIGAAFQQQQQHQRKGATTTSTAATTTTNRGTCLAVLLLSFSLFFFPFSNPKQLFQGRSEDSPDYYSSSSYPTESFRSRTLFGVEDRMEYIYEDEDEIGVFPPEQNFFNELQEENVKVRYEPDPRLLNDPLKVARNESESEHFPRTENFTWFVHKKERKRHVRVLFTASPSCKRIHATPNHSNPLRPTPSYREYISRTAALTGH